VLNGVSLLAAWLLLADAAPIWKAATLDGQAVSGSITDLTNEKLTLQTEAGPVDLPLTQLLGVLPGSTIAPEPPTSDQKPAVWIEFADGTRLPAVSFSSIKGKVKIVSLSGTELAPDLKTISKVRFSETYDPAFKFGREGVAADQVGVKKKAGLDFLEGIIGDVTAETVNFTLDGDPLPVNRNKIDSLVYVQRGEAELPTPVCVLDDFTGGQYQAKEFKLDDSQLSILTLGGITVTRPLEQIKKFDFSAGKLQYLSDLKPESVNVTPFVELPKQFPALQQYFAPRFDQGRDDAALRLDGKAYTKGLALHSRTELVYKIPAKSRKFLALAGIDDSVGSEGHVAVKISGDGRELYSGNFSGLDKAVPLEIDITGVRKLTILVDYGQDLDVGDYFDLAEARIVK
jgi:hypothetical protein